jgi:hypothetical protein
MGTVYDFLMAWKDLIIKVFGAYPLAAALVTILAAGAFYMLEKQWRREHTPTNLMLMFVAWAIAVPILGFLINVLGVIWSLVEKFIAFIAWVFGSLYGIYERHPYLVLGVVLAAVLCYFAWGKWKPNVLPNPLVRGLLLTSGALLIVHIVSPLWPAGVASTDKGAADGRSIQPSKTQPPAKVTEANPTLTPIVPVSQPTK